MRPPICVERLHKMFTFNQLDISQVFKQRCLGLEKAAHGRRFPKRQCIYRAMLQPNKIRPTSRNKDHQKSIKCTEKKLISPPINPLQKTEYGLICQRISCPQNHMHQQGFSKPSIQTFRTTIKNKIFTFNLPSMTCESILKDNKRYLTPYEQIEIKEYRKVWYVGKKDTKLRTQTTSEEARSFDDDQGFYKSRIGDHLAYRFEILRVIGSGFAGKVLKCKDHKTTMVVAVKVFRNTTEGQGFAEAELKVLKTLQKLDKSNKANIVHMKEYFYFRNHLCITFDLFEKDLFKALMQSKMRRLHDGEMRKYATDVLKCLLVLKGMKIVHGDLKPENILLDKENNAAVSDFGGCIFLKDNDRPTIYTLPYMSPELLLGKTSTPATDMWSLGCMLAELDRGYALFGGHTKADMFYSITRVLGLPPIEIQVEANEKKFRIGSPDIESSKLHKNTLAMRIRSSNPKFLDFISYCLEYDAKKRLTPEQALRHPWILNTDAPKPIKTTIKMSVKAAKTSLLKRDKMAPPLLQPLVLHK
ncbi:dual specificity tyrosine-phosphorylation-regulated kinase 4-like isoform X1 [Syngnathoides biaculeatus]|uniref:dual specificity tyrosine-phosphorylation-regulated kinase 4-like isoform X1 n=1 Tax=Syngnathoides biaculeatus TaxID=300417 RepID=UPI002ADDB283|nr:dual specificity tyrosine-phosphorylation-regulated kinase 4-like isoform X1 [Syngnathoides biaculeatus]